MNKALISVATVAILLVSLVFVAGCAPSYTQEQVDAALQTALNNQQAADNAKLAVVQEQLQAVADEKAALAAAKAEAEAKQAALEAEKTAQATQVTSLQALIDQMNAEKAVEVSKVETGKEYDELELSSVLDKTLDHSDLEGLVDEDISFDDDSYAVHEELNMLLEVGNNGNPAYDEDFSGNIYIVGREKGDLSYELVFDDSITVADISADEKLEVPFLGKTLRIVEADDASIVVEEGDRYSLIEGETVTIDGKQVTLVAATSTKALIKVGDYQEIISENSDKRVGGLDIRVDEAISSSRNGYAEIVIGNDVRRTIEDGDEWIEDDSRYIFTMNVDAGQLESLGISFDERFEDLKDDVEPLGLGDTIAFPDDYVTIAFDATSDPTYETVSLDYDSIDVGDHDEKVAVLSADSLLSVDDEDAKEVYFLADGSVWYKDDDGKLVESTSDAAVIEYKDTTLDVVVAGGLLTVTDPDGKVLSFDVRVADEKLGDNAEDAEATDVVYDGNNFGALEGDLLTSYGVVVKDVEGNADNDVVEFEVPEDRLTATVFISVTD